MSKAEYCLHYFKVVWTWPTVGVVVLLLFRQTVIDIAGRVVSSETGEAQVGSFKFSFDSLVGMGDDASKPLVRINGQSFGNVEVELDGYEYINCTFNRSTLVYRGDSGGVMKFCKLIEPNFLVAGPARRTLTYLTALHKTPGAAPIVEGTFEQIRSGFYLQGNSED